MGEINSSGETLPTANLSATFFTTPADDDNASTTTDGRLLWLSPVPNWVQAKECWGDAWPFHVYFFGTCFLALAIVAAVQLVAFRRSPNGARGSSLNRRHRRSSSGLLPPPVLLLVTTIGVLRTISLYTDPYGSEKRLPKVLGRVMFGLGFTCLLAAYQLLFAALNAALRMEVGSFGWLRKRWLIFSVVAFFLTFNTLVDIVLIEALKAKSLLLVCMIANALWCILLISEFSVVAYRLHSRMAITRKMTQSDFKKSTTSGGCFRKKRSKSSMSTLSMTSISTQTKTNAIQSSMRNSTAPNGLGRRDNRDHQRWSLRHKLLKSVRGHGEPANKHGASLSSTRTLKAQVSRPQKTQLWIEMLALFTVGVATCHFSIQFYMILCMTGAAEFEELVKPWTWYSIATLARVVELSLASAILTTLVAAQRRMKRRTTVLDMTDLAPSAGGSRSTTPVPSSFARVEQGNVLKSAGSGVSTESLEGRFTNLLVVTSI